MTTMRAEYFTAQPLPSSIIADLVAGASKLAAAWLKIRRTTMPGWTSGSYEMDLDAALGNDAPIHINDYGRIATGVQQRLEEFIPISPGLVPDVSVVIDSSGIATKPMLYVWFHEPSEQDPE